MARLNAFSVKVEAGQLEELVANLGALTPEALGALLVETINEQADSAYDLARGRMLAGINLTDQYVQRKMRVEHATANAPVATIVASGARKDMTSLSHYGAMQEAKKVNWSNERIRAAGHKFGPWPGWTRRTGAAGVGIAEGLKAAGKTVEVTRGKRMRLGSQFSIPGKKDNDGNLIIFRRNKAGKIESLAGPSVYQLFRVAAGLIEDHVGDNLESAIADAAERQLKKALG